MQPKTRTLVLKLVFLIIVSPILIALFSRSLHSIISTMLFVYSILAFILLVRIILERFDILFIGDYLFSILFLYAAFYGILRAVPLIIMWVLSTYNPLLKKEIIVKIGSIILPLLASLMLHTDFTIRAIMMLIIYLAISFAGYHLLNLDKKRLIVEAACNGVMMLILLSMSRVIPYVLF